VTDPAELFALLTGQLEDLYGIAVEGQSADQPTEYLYVLIDSMENEIRLLSKVLTELRVTIGGLSQ